MEATEKVIELLSRIAEASDRTIDARRCYTTEEAAIALRVSAKSIHRMVESGMRYRSIIERGYIFLGEDLLDFLETQKRSLLRRREID